MKPAPLLTNPTDIRDRERRGRERKQRCDTDLTQAINMFYIIIHTHTHTLHFTGLNLLTKVCRFINQAVIDLMTLLLTLRVFQSKAERTIRDVV